jgi:hypothetical protein
MGYRRERAVARRRAAVEAYGDWHSGAENDTTVVPIRARGWLSGLASTSKVLAHQSRRMGRAPAISQQRQTQRLDV